MGILQKINKGIDIIFKLGLLIAAFGLALLPLPFIFGNQELHSQPLSDDILLHSSRALELQSLKNLQFSNVFVNTTDKSSSSLRQTVNLGDYICYWLHGQGYSVVRKNLELSGRKKGKKGIESLPAATKVHSLIEEPPFLSLKSKISKYIDFQHPSLKEKYWVIVSPGELDSHFINQIVTISDRNLHYKFIIVTPNPISNKIFRRNSNNLIQQANNLTQASTSEESVPTTEGQPEVIQSKNKKGKKRGKKAKVQVVEVIQEQPVNSDL